MKSSRNTVLVCSLLILAVVLPNLSLADGNNSNKKKNPVRWAEITITGSYEEAAEAMSLFGGGSETLAVGLNRLKKAADDIEVEGVLLTLKSPSLGWGKIHEFRQAIKQIQAKGKKVFAYCDSPGNAGYVLAASCDKVLMPESGSIMLLGLRMEISFYKNLFTKLNIQPDMLRVGKYKAAAEPFMRTQMSEHFRKEMGEILDDDFEIMVSSIAEDRNISKEKVENIIDHGPYSTPAAFKLGLVDRMLYVDELPAFLQKESDSQPVKLVKSYGKKKVDTDFSGPLGFMKLLNTLMGGQQKKRSSSNPKIAIVHATGTITTGKSTVSFMGVGTLGADTFIKAVNQAANDKTVKAIVLRIDSPGGSALASDLMWRALQKAGKPIIVSMGDVAGSGGYYIAMGADYIFAEPGTLTGSIGVVGGKVALNGLYEKVGITTTVLSRGKNSGATSLLTPFSESERNAMTSMILDTYKQFTTKAATGRKMEYAKLEKLARGRVYSGKKALQLGLVDELGTMDAAIAKAKKLSGVALGENWEQLVLPKPSNPFEALFGGGTSARVATQQLGVEILGSFSPELQRHLQQLKNLTRDSQDPVMLVMPFHVRIR